MKEVTEWNGHPRLMWVWDRDVRNKYEEYTVCILTEKELKEADTIYPVITSRGVYSHCAEIEEEPKKETRLTNYEVGQLLKCFGVDLNYDNGEVYNNKAYLVKNENEEISEDYKIRYKQGKWEEPTRETVLKWWCRESSDSDIARFVSSFGWGEDNINYKTEE